MPLLSDDEGICRILEEARTICVVGISPDPSRPSHFVSSALMDLGFRVYLVNPIYAGQTILGQRVYSSVRDIPDEIDIIDVFRRPSSVPELAEEAERKGFRTFWMQPGTENMDVARRLLQGGYNVVLGRCTRTESLRLSAHR